MSLFRSTYLYLKLIENTYFRIGIIQKIVIIIIIDVFYYNPFY